MINFIAQISFDEINKEESLIIDNISNRAPGPYLVKSYQDKRTKIKYATSKKPQFIKKTNDKKFLVIANICREDRQKLRQFLNISGLDSKSDPELLLELYLKHGEDKLKILSHGFIFILVDYHKKIVKASTLSNIDNLLFIRNSVNGNVEVKENLKVVSLNSELHKNK